VAFVDFLITFLIMVVLMAWYRFLPDWRILLLPAFIVLAFPGEHEPSLWITALNVKY
jgi:lipopolysaccharide transport system permease protein